MKRRTSNAVKALLISLALIPAWAQATTEMYFIHTDHLGTPQVMTDDTGSEVWRASYRPFGEVVSVEGSADLALRFPGQYEDPETGYYYNYFRDYDPSLGRYVQSDPIGLKGGLNTYGYVTNNPLSLVDPLGLWSISIDAYAGFGGGITVGYNDNGGGWFGGGRVGFGAGGGFNLDLTDNGPGNEECSGSGGTKYGTFGSLGASFGPLGGSYGFEGGRYSNGGSFSTTPTLGGTFNGLGGKGFSFGGAVGVQAIGF